ncbi:unnamed protein product [Closterium sp. NIES-53]
MAGVKITSQAPRIMQFAFSLRRPLTVTVFLAALLHATATAVPTAAATTEPAISGNHLADTVPPVASNRRLLSDAAQLVSSHSGPVTVTSSVGSSSPHATARMLYARFPEIRNDDRDHAHYLDPQNRARAEVGSPALVWDAELQAQAERLAEYLAQKEGCAVRRMKEISGGVNLRWAAESWGVPVEAESAVAEWVREKAHYRLEAFPAGCAEGRDCTHYTQVVWKKTERVGCGTAMCNEGGAIWACRYFPPGNIEGNRPY